MKHPILWISLTLVAVVAAGLLLPWSFLRLRSHQDKQALDYLLPDIGSSGSISVTAVAIDLWPNGEVWVDGNLVDTVGEHQELLELRALLADATSDKEATLAVTLSAHDEAAGSWFVEILNELARAEITNVTLSGFQD